MALHKDIPYGCNHIIHSLEYANEAARTGATGLDTDDVGRVAAQLDNDTFWLLTDYSPVTWIQLGVDTDLDVTVKVSSNDTTAGYLNGKLTASSPITLTENNDGGNETLDIGIGSHNHTESDITDLDHYDSTDFATDFAASDLNDLGTKNHNDLNGIGTDDHHSESHTIVSHSDTSATGTELDTLTDSSNADSLHTHTHSATTGQTANDHHNEDHATRHTTGGADEIDGDKLDVDWNPTNYVPTTSPSEADNVDNLTAHLAGIDTALAGGSTDIAVKVTSNDTNSSFLNEKLTTTEGIQKTEINDGGDEDLQLSLDIDGLDVLTDIDNSLDYLVIWDESASVHKKFLLNDLILTNQKCVTYSGIENPSSTYVAWTGTGDNNTLVEYEPEILVSGLSELTTSGYQAVATDDDLYVSTITSTEDEGSYSLFKLHTDRDASKIYNLDIETISKIETTETTICDFDTVSGHWTASNPATITLSTNTSIHQEGTGCLQINTDGASGDSVYHNFSPALDLSNAHTFKWWERINSEGSAGGYKWKFTDSSGNSKTSTVEILNAQDDVWAVRSTNLQTSFTENQSPATTDMSDIVKISVLFSHASGAEIFYFDRVSIGTYKRQEISLWNDTKSTWVKLLLGDSYSTTWEEMSRSIKCPQDFIDSNGDVYLRIRSYDPVEMSTDELKVDFVRMCFGLTPTCRPVPISQALISWDKPYLRADSSSYEVLARFIWDGSVSSGWPSEATVLASHNDDTKTSSIRIYDVTNSQVIVEKTGFVPTTETVFQILDLGVPNNVSDDEAVWELQAKTSGGEVWIGYLSVK